MKGVYRQSDNSSGCPCLCACDMLMCDNRGPWMPLIELVKWKLPLNPIFSCVKVT